MNSFIAENPPIDKKLKKKRKREDENEAAESRKFFKADNMQSEQLTTPTCNDSKEYNSSSCGSANEEEEGLNNDEDDEMPSTKFRRGEELPSDLDIGSDCNSADSNEPTDELDDGDWNMMGAALEREFLGLE